MSTIEICGRGEGPSNLLLDSLEPFSVVFCASQIVAWNRFKAFGDNGIHGMGSALWSRNCRNQGTAEHMERFSMLIACNE